MRQATRSPRYPSMTRTQVTRCVRHNQRRHVELIGILLQCGVIRRGITLHIARYLSGNLHNANQIFSRIGAVERIVGKALCRHVIDNVGKALLGRPSCSCSSSCRQQPRVLSPTGRQGAMPGPNGRPVSLWCGRVHRSRQALHIQKGEGSSKYFDTRRSMVPSASISW